MVDNINQCVHIGQIFSVGKHNILIGHLNSGEDFFTPLLFWFDKPYDKDISRNSLVYYKIENVEESIASVIDSVDDVPHAYGGNLDYRADRKIHNDKEWELIKQKSMFYKDDKIWIPKTISNGETEYSNIKLSRISQVIFKTHFAIMRLNHELITNVSLIANKIVEFENYIDSLNIDAILSTYEVASWGYYKRVVGKDNYYCYGNYKRIDSDDKYIRSLLPLEEKSDYYNTDIQTDEEQDFTNYDNVEAERNIKLAKHKYSKKEHLALLINEYYLELQKKKVSLCMYKLIFDEFFSLSIGAGCLIGIDVKTFIKEYNNELIRNPRKRNLVFIQSLIHKIDNGYFK